MYKYNIILYSINIKFKLMSEKYKTQESCIEAVQINKWALNCVPEKFMTQQLCKLAVENFTPCKTI